VSLDGLRPGLERVDEFIANRQAYCQRYQRLLGGVDGIRTPRSDYEGVSPFIYWIRVEGGRRAALIRHLRERGIETGIHFMPAHSYSFYRDCRRGELPVTEQVCSEVLTLPLHSFMHEDDIDYVGEAIAHFLA